MTINNRISGLLKWLKGTEYNWCIFEWSGMFYKLFRNGQMRQARMDEVYKYPRGLPNG